MGSNRSNQNQKSTQDQKGQEAQPELTTEVQPSEEKQMRSITQLEMKIIDEAIRITTGEKSTDYDLMQLTQKYIDQQ